MRTFTTRQVLGTLLTLIGVLYAGSLYGRFHHMYTNIHTSSGTTDKPLQSDMIVNGKLFSGAFPGETKHVVHTQSFEPLSFPVYRNESFDYKSAMEKLNKEKVSQDDPRLIELIRNYYIVPPSTDPYRLREEKLDYSLGQSPVIDSALNYMEGGFYVDCGACDGEWGSNSLFFERVRKWNGVLIEADPVNFKHLLDKHRKAFMINACLSSNPYPGTVLFTPNYFVGKIDRNPAGKNNPKNVEVQCFPLYSILLALNQLKVDFFSLDVEGGELEVLKTIPFEKVDIKTMAVEYVHIPEGEDGLRDFGRKLGYQSLLKLYKWNWWVADIIFKK